MADIEYEDLAAHDADVNARIVGAVGDDSITKEIDGEIRRKLAATAFRAAEMRGRITVIRPGSGVVTSFPVAEMTDAMRGSTLVAAVDETNPGDVVYVPAGDYQMTTGTVVKDGVTLYLEKGATLFKTGTVAGPVIAITTAITFSILGKGRIWNQGVDLPGPADEDRCHAVRVEAPGATVTIEVDELRATGNLSAALYAGSCGAGLVRVNKLVSVAYDGIWCAAVNGSVSRWVVDAQTIESLGTGADGDAIEAVSVDPFSNYVIRAQYVSANGGNSVHSVGGCPTKIVVQDIKHTATTKAAIDNLNASLELFVQRGESLATEGFARLKAGGNYQFGRIRTTAGHGIVMSGIWLDGVVSADTVVVAWDSADARGVDIALDATVAGREPTLDVKRVVMTNAGAKALNCDGATVSLHVPTPIYSANEFDTTSLTRLTAYGGPMTPTSGPPEVVADAGTSFSVAVGASFLNKYLRTISNDPVTITVQDDAIEVGTEVLIEQAGLGQITFAAGSGAQLLTSAGFALKSAAQHAVLGLKKITSSGWILTGDREVV